MPTKFLFRLTATFVFLSILRAGAQQTAPSAAPSAPTQPAQPSSETSTPPQQPTDDGKKESKATNGSTASGTSNDRLFFTLPNFLTLENAGQVPPLTTKQKFAVVTRGSFDYIQIPWRSEERRVGKEC